MKAIASEFKPRQLNRHGEVGAVPFRNERFYTHRGEWFFSVRRGVDQGPYASEIEARGALREFIEAQLHFEYQLLKDRVG
ncbi:MAG: DUF6316 family protein [Gammaproteobacteria bacterium]|nr:DUF6316 family protein [Gammaproteobacteria bacterium]MDH5650534.1 DUF6316 family protein [Gammaproteobacteria bacterium]